MQCECHSMSALMRSIPDHSNDQCMRSRENFSITTGEPFWAGIQDWWDDCFAPAWSDRGGAAAPVWCNKHLICALTGDLSDSPYNHSMRSIYFFVLSFFNCLFSRAFHGQSYSSLDQKTDRKSQAGLPADS